MKITYISIPDDSKEKMRRFSDSQKIEFMDDLFSAIDDGHEHILINIKEEEQDVQGLN